MTLYPTRPVAASAAAPTHRHVISKQRPALVVAAIMVLALLASAAVLSRPPDAAAAAGNIAPVNATYHGIKPYHTISVGVLDYDAWTYGDIVFYSPPGMVTQDMADQWLAWYAHTDDILRTLIGDDTTFEGRYRRDDVNFGRKKVIGTPPDSCGAGCGNKAQAEGVGIIDNMVAEPDNYEHHWILFYEQARGGRDEIFDLSATWPRENYVLPHLVAALTYYAIDGPAGIQRGVPGQIYSSLDTWIDHNVDYVDQFVEREQRFFGDQYADGTFIYPPQAAIHLHLAVDDGIDTLAAVLDNIGHYPDNFKYENSTQAMCDFRAAINDATDNRYDEISVRDWGLPANCTYDMGQNQAGDFDGDLVFPASGLCADPTYLPNAALVGQFPCNGSPEQQVSFESTGNDLVLVKFGGDKGCLDSGDHRFAVIWGCHGELQQQWRIVNGALQTADGQRCVGGVPRNRWGGGLVTLEPCTGGSDQQIIGGDPSGPIEPIEPPTGLVFPLIHASSGKCVGQQADGATVNVALWPCNDNVSSLQYQYVRGADGSDLRIEHSGDCLDESTANILTWACHGGDNQHFEWVGSQLRSEATGWCLTVTEPAFNGSNVGTAPCSTSETQQFVRPQLAGDVDCDGHRTIIDALMIALYEVTVRTGVTECPLVDPTSQINTAQGDLNGDGFTNVIDAMFVVQCTVEIDNGHC